MKPVQRFAIIAPKHKGFLLYMLVLLLASVITLIRVYSGTAPLGKTILLSLPILLVPMFVWACLRRNHVQLDADTLTITAGPFRLKVPRKALDMQAARIIPNLDTYEDVHMGTKTFGITLPGYLAGHFRQKGNDDKIFALVIDKTRVLALPEHNGRLLLLSLERPGKLLDALSS